MSVAYIKSEEIEEGPTDVQLVGVEVEADDVISCEWHDDFGKACQADYYVAQLGLVNF
jgi:hypothetical protein